MEIVRAFNNNELHTEIIIKGTIENSLFRACDIGEILEISNDISSVSIHSYTHLIKLSTI